MTDQGSVHCGRNMTTFSGRYVDPSNLTPDDIDIHDIASGLSNCCRYAGQCIEFYSVAQHSVLVARRIYQETGSQVLAEIALLHDAPEAYLGDLVRCVKALLPDYQALEAKVWEVVVKKFNLKTGPDLPLEVKIADQRMCVTERRQIISNKSAVWDLELVYDPYPDVKITPTWNPKQAKRQFINAFIGLSTHPEGCTCRFCL